ncbi:GtrA family protein [Pseudomonas oryzihabitans]|uniref:GtrA family protein n=1 Tax=Pseudomonas oryzihabitans TaxID=47885 RepID=UPI00345FEEBD
MIKREIVIFLFVGMLTVFVDFLTYQGLMKAEFMPIYFAKTAGFLAGTLFSYFANKFWTFGQKTYVSGSVWRFSLLYIATLLVNVFINSTALRFTSTLMSFLVATGVSAMLNFLGMKFFVFKPARVSELS